MNIRIGHGDDAHRFGEGVFVTLAGVQVPHSQGVIAHSDGDVLLHALCDALLGAIGAGDIGQHFPDTDATWKGANSRALLRHVMSLVRAPGYQVANTGCTRLAEPPRIGKYRTQMAQCVAEDIGTSAVNIKATTTEKMGWIGRQEGLAAHAVVLLIGA